ncbi:MAG: NTP transferase domain-containing protein [Candidatus Omnitrophica bacterium]|nr:NTP transferase domain-containing protein [Candidatus Omnitrophota bacterium]
MSKCAIILSGGLGTRLKPFTEVIPKPLLPIGEKAVLEIQIERLKKYGFDHIFLATNYKADYIEHFFGDGSRYHVKLEISREDRPLGTAGPVRLLKERVGDSFIVMNGDILSLVDFDKLFNFANSNKSLLTVAIKKLITPYAFGNIYFDGDLVTGIEEKPDIVSYVLAGIYVMKAEIMDLIPENEYFGMDTLIKKMLELKLPITKHEITEYWLDIGQIKDYEKAHGIYKDYFSKDE